MSNNQKYIVLPGGKECKPVNEWVEISNDNLPADLLICEWQHPELGIIKGNIVRYQPNPGEHEESVWIYPNPDPVSQADIWIGEFTHYRKIAKVFAITEVMPDGETFEGSEVWQYYSELWDKWFDGDMSGFNSYQEFEQSDDLIGRIAIKPLKAIEPVGYADLPYPLPLADVVENKETVEQAASNYAGQWFKNDQHGHEDFYTAGQHFISGANWQQSQSIDGIVGFVTNYIADNIGEQIIQAYLKGDYAGCKKLVMDMETDIIKEYNNGNRS